MAVDAETPESVRLAVRPHGVALARPLLRATLVAAVGAALVLFATRVVWPLGAVGAGLLAVAALLALRAVLAWDRTTLVVTEGELAVAYGVVRRRSAAVRLDGTPLEVDQSILGRLLGYGTLVAGELEVPYVPGARRLVSRPSATAEGT